MRPVVNYAYKFSFVTKFDSLDGIYLVKAIYSFSELVNNDINLLEELYVKNGLTNVDFDQDIEAIREKDILMLVDVDDDTNIVYMPEGFLKNIPEFNVVKYVDLGMAISLGVYDSQDAVETLVAELLDIVQAKTGITDGVVVYSKEDKWMTTTDYEAIANVREANITDTSNAYTDLIALQKENQQLRDLITYYEDLITSM